MNKISCISPNFKNKNEENFNVVSVNKIVLPNLNKLLKNGNKDYINEPKISKNLF